MVLCFKVIDWGLHLSSLRIYLDQWLLFAVFFFVLMLVISACYHLSHKNLLSLPRFVQGGKICLSITQPLLYEDLAVNIGIIILKLISMWLLYHRCTTQPQNVNVVFWVARLQRTLKNKELVVVEKNEREKEFRKNR